MYNTRRVNVYAMILYARRNEFSIETDKTPSAAVALAVFTHKILLQTNSGRRTYNIFYITAAAPPYGFGVGFVCVQSRGEVGRWRRIIRRWLWNREKFPPRGNAYIVASSPQRLQLLEYECDDEDLLLRGNTNRADVYLYIHMHIRICICVNRTIVVGAAGVIDTRPVIFNCTRVTRALWEIFVIPGHTRRHTAASSYIRSEIETLGSTFAARWKGVGGASVELYNCMYTRARALFDFRAGWASLCIIV